MRPAWCSTTWPTWKWIARAARAADPLGPHRGWRRHRRAGWLLLAAGAALPWIVAYQAGQVRPGLVGTLLAAAILLYDLGLKRTPLGPLAMGGCRMLNVLLGMSLLAGPLHGEHFLVAGGIGLYIVGVSWLARNETAVGDRRQLFAGTLLMMAGIGLLGCLPLVLPPDLLMIPPERWYLLLGLLGMWIGWRCVYAVIDPATRHVRVAVTYGIMSLVVLDATACCAVRGACPGRWRFSPCWPRRSFWAAACRAREGEEKAASRRVYPGGWAESPASPGNTSQRPYFPSWSHPFAAARASRGDKPRRSLDNSPLP